MKLRMIMLIGAMCTPLAFASGVAYAARAANGAQQPVCGNHVAKDYGSVFREMEPVSPPPESGILPFAPDGSQFYQTSASQIQLTNGAFGYAFTSRNPRRRLRLDWFVKTSIARVDRRGRSVGVVRKRRQNFVLVQDIRDLDFTMNLPARIGLYRYDIEFQEIGGSKLAKYSQYVRVVRPTLSAALRLTSASYQPGEVASIQVANVGTEPIAYGEEIRVKVFNGNSWEPSSSFQLLPIHRRAQRLNAGEAGRCEALRISSAVPPGLYRIEKQVSTLFGQRSRLLTAGFNVRQ